MRYDFLSVNTRVISWLIDIHNTSLNSRWDWTKRSTQHKDHKKALVPRGVKSIPLPCNQEFGEAQTLAQSPGSMCELLIQKGSPREEVARSLGWLYWMSCEGLWHRARENVPTCVWHPGSWNALAISRPSYSFHVAVGRPSLYISCRARLIILVCREKSTFLRMINV